MGRKSQRLGKKGEYLVLGKMLDLSLDVYVPVVDVENIDFIVRNKGGNYKVIQVKTRSQEKPIFDISLPKIKQDYFVILHIDGTEDFWILPFRIFAKYRVKSKYFSKRGIVRMILNEKRKKALEEYRGRFDFLIC